MTDNSQKGKEQKPHLRPSVGTSLLIESEYRPNLESNSIVSVAPLTDLCMIKLSFRPTNIDFLFFFNYAHGFYFI